MFKVYWGLFLYPYIMKMIARIYCNTLYDEPTTNREQRRVYIQHLIVIDGRCVALYDENGSKNILYCNCNCIALIH